MLQLPHGIIWELEYKAQHENNWTRMRAGKQTHVTVNVTGLAPGTKYLFRSRAGEQTVLLPRAVMVQPPRRHGMAACLAEVPGPGHLLLKQSKKHCYDTALAPGIDKHHTLL